MKGVSGISVLLVAWVRFLGCGIDCVAGVWRGFEGRALKGNLVGVAEELRSLVVAEFEKEGGEEVGEGEGRALESTQATGRCCLETCVGGENLSIAAMCDERM